MNILNTVKHFNAGFNIDSLKERVRDLPRPCCVLEQDTFTPKKVLVIPRKWWLRPDMTEKLLTWTLSHNKTKIFKGKIFCSELELRHECCDVCALYVYYRLFCQIQILDIIQSNY